MEEKPHRMSSNVGLKPLTSNIQQVDDRNSTWYQDINQGKGINLENMED